MPVLFLYDEATWGKTIEVMDAACMRDTAGCFVRQRGGSMEWRAEKCWFYLRNWVENVKMFMVLPRFFVQIMKQKKLSFVQKKLSPIVWVVQIAIIKPENANEIRH